MTLSLETNKLTKSEQFVRFETILKAIEVK